MALLGYEGYDERVIAWCFVYKHSVHVLFLCMDMDRYEVGLLMLYTCLGMYDEGAEYEYLIIIYVSKPCSTDNV